MLCVYNYIIFNSNSPLISRFTRLSPVGGATTAYHMSRQNPAILDTPYNSTTPSPIVSSSNRQSMVMASLVKQSLANKQSQQQLSIVQLASKGGMSKGGMAYKSKERRSPVMMKLSNPLSTPPLSSIVTR